MKAAAAKAIAGSSLRVRGTAGANLCGEGLFRVIPACAGNSAARSDRGGRATGHPCVCGEQASTNGPKGIGSGSSLRVRGTGVNEWTERDWERVIPACAGNRLSELMRNRV